MVDQALNRRFQTVIVNEPDEKETINILDKIKDNYEKFHKVKIDNSIIKEIVNIGNKFLTNRKNPDKSIELLDSCCTHANYNESKIVTVRDLYDLIYDRYGVDLLNNDMLKLLNSKKIIISQNPTELIKSLSSNYSNIINIDCRLYQDEVDIFELLGNPKDVNKSGGYLLKSALDYPLGFITITNMNYNKILKEFIDKLLNNRYIIDNYGNKLNFSNYIIILEKSLSNKSLGFTPLNSCISVNNYSFDNDNLIKL
jgi:ATP-dependent Clp protease ATP-binding subunit ClpA